MISDKPKVMLVKPPYKRLRGICDHPYVPLGIAYISSYLRNNGYDTLIYNGDIQDRISLVDESFLHAMRHEHFVQYGEVLKSMSHEALTEFEKLFLSYRPDILGVSVLSNEAGAAGLISNISKKLLPNVPIVWGGPHPTFLARDILESYKTVDYAVIGEGEKTFKGLCDVLSSCRDNMDCDLHSLKGIAFRGPDGRVIINSNNQQIKELDELPFPDFDNIAFKERYTGMYMGNISASRGCPYRCGFCSSRAFWKCGVRYRSVENIIEEINYRIKDLKINHFTFVDDSFTIKKELIGEMCEAIINNDIPFFWGTMTRADLVDEATISLMKRASCIHLHFGIETGSRQTAERISKDLDLDRAKVSINAVQKAGVPVGTFFIIGFPDETREQMLETLEYIKGIRPSRIGFNIFEPQPGASLYDYLIIKGIISPRCVEWDNFPMYPDGHYLLNMDFEEFNDIVNMFCDYIFSYNRKLSVKYMNYKVNFLRRLRHDPKYFVKKFYWFSRKRLDAILKRSNAP